jgi:hypothetical protein
MAHQTLLRMSRSTGPTGDDRRRDDQQRRGNLRIAVRQLERADLYVAALYSLNLEDREAEANVDDLLGRLQALRRYLRNQMIP